MFKSRSEGSLKSEIAEEFSSLKILMRVMRNMRILIEYASALYEIKTNKDAYYCLSTSAVHEF